MIEKEVKLENTSTKGPVKLLLRSKHQLQQFVGFCWSPCKPSYRLVVVAGFYLLLSWDFPFSILLPSQDHGGTASMCWTLVRPPVVSTCFARRVLTGSCRPGVNRVELREGGRSSRGDKMGQSTFSGPGSSTR